MKITSKTIAFAIHRVLGSQQVCVGCGLPLRELLRLWPETMLRRGDLIAGLEQLRLSGHLSIEPAPEGPIVRLRDESFGLVTTAEERAAVATLNDLRERRKRPATHLQALLPSIAFGRRTGDEPTAA